MLFKGYGNSATQKTAIQHRGLFKTRQRVFLTCGVKQWHQTPYQPTIMILHLVS